MSFFMRTALVVGLVAGAVHVFRKDLVKIAGVLRKPAQNFVKEVQTEMKAAQPSLPTTAVPPPPSPPAPPAPSTATSKVEEQKVEEQKLS